MEEDERESSPLRPLPHNGGDTTSIYQVLHFKLIHGCLQQRINNTDLQSVQQAHSVFDTIISYHVW